MSVCVGSIDAFDVFDEAAVLSLSSSSLCIIVIIVIVVIVVMIMIIMITICACSWIATGCLFPNQFVCAYGYAYGYG